MRRSPTIYRSETGRYWTSRDLWRRFESGEWTPYMWDEDTEKEWVETADGEIIELVPVERSDLPADLSVRETEYGAELVDAAEN